MSTPSPFARPLGPVANNILILLWQQPAQTRSQLFATLQQHGEQCGRESVGQSITKLQERHAVIKSVDAGVVRFSLAADRAPVYATLAQPVLQASPQLGRAQIPMPADLEAAVLHWKAQSCIAPTGLRVPTKPTKEEQGPAPIILPELDHADTGIASHASRMLAASAALYGSPPVVIRAGALDALRHQVHRPRGDELAQSLGVQLGQRA